MEMAATESIHILTDRVERIACHKCGHRIDVSDVEPFTTITCPACGVQTPVPAQLGPFLLFKELGQGAMGAVYQAFDKTLKRHVAIKVMHRSVGKDRQFVEQFLGEARALAALNQPNVVQIYSCGEEKGQPYIVMELVPGGRVDQMMHEAKPMDEAFVLKIGIDVAQGLQAAHRIGLTHGDIKPENILFAKDGTAKVVDFGLASFGGQQPKPGEIWGTPYYIAPEKVRGGKGDQQADIYSLGASLFHILTGRPPFDADTAQEVVVARLHHPAPDVRALRDDLHAETAALLARMLEADPYRRYPNYDSLLADMRQTLRAVEAGPAAPDAARRGPASRKPLLVGLLALAVVMMAGAGWWLSRAGKKTRHGARPSRPASRSPAVLPTPAAQPAKETKTRHPKPAAKKREAKKPTRPMMTFPLSRQDADVVLESTADGYVQGRSKSKNNADTSYAAKKELWVKAAPGNKLHLARKTYIRFDLAPVKGAPVHDATLVLTAARGGKNAAGASYALQLWGVKRSAAGRDWTEEEGDRPLTWNSAPANRTKSADRLTKDAVLLARITVPANVSPGAAIKFSNGDSVEENRLVEFINSMEGVSVLFVVTAEGGSAQRAGWKFVSREGGRKKAPALLLKR